MDHSLKFDQGKLPLHLIDPLWLTTTAQVLDHGQQKYGPWNWAKGTFSYSRLYSALQRHLQAWWNGEELDQETGLPHLWHANCCMMFLTRYTHDLLGTDDRFPFSSVPAVHPGHWNQAQQPNDPGRSTGGGGGEAGDPVRGVEWPGTEPDAPRSWDQPRRPVQDERLLDSTERQPAVDLDALAAAVEGARQTGSSSDEGGGEIDVPAPEFDTRTRKARKGD